MVIIVSIGIKYLATPQLRLTLFFPKLLTKSSIIRSLTLGFSSILPQVSNDKTKLLLFDNSKTAFCSSIIPFSLKLVRVNLSSKHFLPRIVLATLKYWNNEFFPTKSKSFITPVTLSTQSSPVSSKAFQSLLQRSK